ncbi:MAG TPA: long-chain fatty acid--CoA ligase [Polyangiaceae bacterium]|nr:long-chain fatty acid--CoA ligase [Polyangiaceae bacterium]
MPGGLSSLVELCERSCDRFAGRPLFGTKTGDGWSWLTYGDFHALVDRCRAGLRELGVGASDHVGIVSNNRVEWAACAYAAYGLGAAIVPMYEAQLGSEWEYILADCRAAVVFAATDAIAVRLRSARADLPALRHVVAFDAGPDDPASFAALLERGRATPVSPLMPVGDLEANLIYTSGTTGKPKGVVLSHGNIVSNINALHEIFPFEPDDRSLSFLPWAHSFGQAELHVLLSMGCALALNRDVARLVDDLAEIRPTILVAVPRVFHRLYGAVQAQIRGRPRPVRSLFSAGLRRAARRSRGERLGPVDRILLRLADRLIFSKVRERFGGRLKYAISGSAALGREVGEFIDALGLTVYEGYGLTETSPIVSANYPGNRRLGSVGKAIPGVRVHIDRAVGDGVDGEIVIYGPNVMQGYHNRPEENAVVRLPDGGFRTGDLGRLDDDGYLYVTGRIKEQFKLENGKYVMPSPLEDELKLSPFIANAFIYGENKPWCVALVVPDAARLQQWAEEQRVPLADPTRDERVRALVAREIDERSRSFKKFERPRAFALVAEDFTAQGGLLTPTQKLKRRAIVARYRDWLEALYQSPGAAQERGLAAASRGARSGMTSEGARQGGAS